eukprot:4292295-Amphidinium_carterae.1
MSLHYAPDFFKTLTTQKRDDLRALEWTEAQVQQHEQELQATKLLELYAILPQKAVDMWITMTHHYMWKSTSELHGHAYRHKTWILQLPYR